MRKPVIVVHETSRETTVPKSYEESEVLAALKWAETAMRAADTDVKYIVKHRLNGVIKEFSRA